MSYKESLLSKNFAETSYYVIYKSSLVNVVPNKIGF